MTRLHTAAAWAAGLTSMVCVAREYYVATNGSDYGSGTISSPYRTIQFAADRARTGDVVIIRGGVYREQVRPAFSGQAGLPIVYRPYGTNGTYEEVTISACEVITGWQYYGTVNGTVDIYRAAATAKITDSSAQSQLFVDGRMMVDARWPNISVNDVTYVKNAHKAVATGASGRFSEGITTNKFGWYEAPGIAGFAKDALRGTKINFMPGRMWFMYTGNVSSNDGQRIYIDLNGTVHNFDTWANWPQVSNFFYVWNGLQLLDARGEYFTDGTNYYLATPSGLHPSNHVIEAKARLYAFNLNSRSYTHLEGLRFFAGTLVTDASSNYNEFRRLDVAYVGHILDMSRVNSTAQQPRVFGINGRWNVLRDSRLRYSASVLLSLSGQNNAAVNNVISEAGYLLGQAVAANYQTQFGYLPPPSSAAEKNGFLGNTVYNGSYTLIEASPGRDIVLNDVYNSHAQGTDVGAISSWATDGRGAVIASNFVHTAPGINDHSLGYYGGHGIYLDKGTRNYLICNNVVWDTTAGAIHMMQYNGDGYTNIPDCNRKVYHNTVRGKISFNKWSATETAGTEFINNLATETEKNDIPATTNYWIVTHNYDTTNDAEFVNIVRHDFRLQPWSGAVGYGMVISGFTSGFEGAAPDAGAYEGQVRWRPGAVIRDMDVPGLVISFRPESGTSVCMVTGLPEGRILPRNFGIKIGTNAFEGTFENVTDYSVHLTRGYAYDLPLPPAGQRFPYWLTLDGVTEYFMGTGAVNAAAVTAVDPDAGGVEGGNVVQVYGTGFLPRGTTRVMFGGLEGSAVTVVDDGVLNVRVPAWTGEVHQSVSVAVYNPDGTWAVKSGAYTYVPEGGIGLIGLIGPILYWGMRRKRA